MPQTDSGKWWSNCKCNEIEITKHCNGEQNYIEFPNEMEPFNVCVIYWSKCGFSILRISIKMNS